MAELPSGTVTFLFTDMEGSSRLWEIFPDAMHDALARHDAILRETVERHRGSIVKMTGDGVHAVFATARDAVDAAVAAQHELAATEWATGEPLRVRMGVHTGEAEIRAGDYYGTALNRAARLMSVAHGEQILVSLSTQSLVSDSLGGDLTLIDLGEQRLRDLSRAERIFLVVSPTLRVDFPPIRTLDAFPGNLPLQVTSFVGRRDELVELSDALDESRLVTITGAGGVGKTRVAVQLAAELLQRFRDGAWLIELAAVTDAEAMVELVATTLSVPPRSGLSLEGAIVEFLRSKRALVILDNCEHLLDPASDFAAVLLRECGELRVLATSREALGVAGERVARLRSLPVPDDTASADAIVASDAGRLFVNCAESARPEFMIDASNAAAVGEICRRLDGIPLAIQLAAARLVAMTPTEIAGLLDERFRLLTGGRHAAVERHRTLRAAVDWSYGLLEPRDRTVFDRLGVFAGSFDATAAAAIIAEGELEAWDVIDGLTSLVAKSMLTAETSVGDTTRFQMLETLRQHAAEQLDGAGDADTFRRRHAQHFATFAEEAGTGLMGPDELGWRTRVDAERDNLRAAVQWALDGNDDDALLALRIIAPLAWETMCDPPGGIGAWAERAFDAAVRSDAPQRVAVIGAAAYHVSHLGQHDVVVEMANIALEDDRVRGLTSPAVAAFCAWTSFYGSGRREEADRAGVEMLKRLERWHKDRFGLVMAHCATSYYAVGDGDFITARAESEAARQIAQELQNPTAIASAELNLARSIEADDPVGALAAYEHTIALGRAGAMSLMNGPAFVGIARLRARMGDATGALAAVYEGFDHSIYLGYRPVVVEVLGASVPVLLRAGSVGPGTVFAGALQGALRSFNVRSATQDAEIEQELFSAQLQLGDEEYQRLFDRGAAMSYDDVLEFALECELESLPQTWRSQVSRSSAASGDGLDFLERRRT